MIFSLIIILISCNNDLDNNDTSINIRRSTPSPTFIAYYISKKYGDTLLTRNNYTEICIMNGKGFISFISSGKFLMSRKEIKYFKPLAVFPFEYLNHKFVLINEIYIPKSAIKIILEKVCRLSEKLINNYTQLSKILDLTDLVKDKLMEDNLCRNICVKNVFIEYLRNSLKSLKKISIYIFNLKKPAKKDLSDCQLFFNSLYESLIYDYNSNREIVNEWSDLFEQNDNYQINIMIDKKIITLLSRDIVSKFLINALLSK